jgi:hypothetical protein
MSSQCARDGKYGAIWLSVSDHTRSGLSLLNATYLKELQMKGVLLTGFSMRNICHVLTSIWIPFLVPLLSVQVLEQEA